MTFQSTSFVILTTMSRHMHTRQLPPNLVLAGTCKNKVQKTTHHLKSEFEVEKAENVVRFCNTCVPKNMKIVKKWTDNFSFERPPYNEIAHLNPRIFDVHPKMNVLYEVVEWQKNYREVDYAFTRSRAEIGKGKAKPWPQKNTGRKRQGSRNSPLWKGGGIANGPRGPVSMFYKLSDSVLLEALTSSLTIKSLQNDLHIAASMDCSHEKSIFEKALSNRNMNTNSILFVHSDTENPSGVGEVTESSKIHSTMPLSALNVFSIIKHDKLVLSVNVLDELEDKLIWQMERYDWLVKPHNFYKDLPGLNYIKKEDLVGAGQALNC